MALEVWAGRLEEGDFPAWNELVEGSPDGSLYSTTRYLEVLGQATGGRFSIVAARLGDELAGGVGLFESDSRWGAYVAPRPLLYYNGVVQRRYATKYPSEQTSRHLKASAAIASALKERCYARLSLHCRSSFTDARPFLAAGFKASPQYSYVVDVRRLETAWSRVEQNLRRLVTRCEHEGMTVADDEDFDAFYRLHAATLDRKAAPTYLPEAAFRTYFETLRGEGLCRLYHARLPGGRAVASQLVLLGPHKVSHSVAAAADVAFLRSGASAFLRWRVLAAVSALGYEANDLTDAGLNPVTHFKSQLGGDLHQNLVLEAPQSRWFRVGTSLAGAARRILGGR
jgi:hypothetical protein